jgi:hypothetical protein
MSGRDTYTIHFRHVAVSAVQDLCAAYAGASMALEVVSLTIGQITQTAVENLELSVKHLPATVTAGSGGTAPTPVPGGGVAATFTARVNDTTPATSSGTTVYPHVDIFNLVNGYQWIFPALHRPNCKLSEALVFSLDSAPAGSRTMTGSMTVRELF